MADLTQSRLKELFSYDACTGLFTRLKNRGRAKAGAVAGSLDAAGYIVIEIDGKAYKAHRLAVFYVTGSWPVNDVDHRDLNKANNRFANLREASRAENAANRGANSTNRLSIKGVSRLPSGKFRARLKSKHLGTFPTEEVAAAAYLKAAQVSFGRFARSA